jgi:hypothetical protein
MPASWPPVEFYCLLLDSASSGKLFTRMGMNFVRTALWSKQGCNVLMVGHFRPL